jgi:hypothetical protein
MLCDVFNVLFFSLLMLTEVDVSKCASIMMDCMKYVWPLYLIVYLLGFFKFYLLINGIDFPIFQLKGGEFVWGVSLSPDYNMYALGASTATFIMILILTQNFKQIKYYYGILVTIFCGLASIALTGSRRGYMSLVILLSILVYVSIKNKLKLPIFLLFIFLMALTGIVVSNMSNPNSQIGMVVNRSLSAFSSFGGFSQGLDERDIRWDLAFLMIRQKHWYELLVGTGFEYLKIFAASTVAIVDIDYPHTPILSAILYGGILPMLIVVLWYLVYLKSCVTCLRRQFILALLLANVIMVSSVSENTIFSDPLFTCFSAMLFLSARV